MLTERRATQPGPEQAPPKHFSLKVCISWPISHQVASSLASAGTRMSGLNDTHRHQYRQAGGEQRAPAQAGPRAPFSLSPPGLVCNTEAGPESCWRSSRMGLVRTKHRFLQLWPVSACLSLGPTGRGGSETQNSRLLCSRPSGPCLATVANEYLFCTMYQAPR